MTDQDILAATSVHIKYSTRNIFMLPASCSRANQLQISSAESSSVFVSRHRDKFNHNAWRDDSHELYSEEPQELYITENQQFVFDDFIIVKIKDTIKVIKVDHGTDLSIYERMHDDKRHNYYKKVIYTTDPLLIAENVSELSTTFLSHYSRERLTTVKQSLINFLSN